MYNNDLYNDLTLDSRFALYNINVAISRHTEMHQGKKTRSDWQAFLSR